MKEIKLEIHDMSTVLRPGKAYALVLQEEGLRGRKIAVIIGEAEAQSIKAAYMCSKTDRPLVYEMMRNLLRSTKVKMEKAVIYDVTDGIYSAWLYGENPDGKRFKIDSRTTDAIGLSCYMDFPIYIYEPILEREKIRNESEEDFSYMVSMNNVDMSMLKLTLETAIEIEDYELASIIRDEIERRERKNKQE